MPDTTETNRFSDWFAKHRNGAADIELGHKLSQAVMAAGMTEKQATVRHPSPGWALIRAIHAAEDANRGRTGHVSGVPATHGTRLTPGNRPKAAA